jgi:type IV fimbrial biogenesis protein FimT
MCPRKYAPFFGEPSRPAPCANRRRAGFSLVELAACCAVAAALLVFGAQSFVAIGNSVRLSSAANTFLSHLYLARSESIKRNGRVVLCKSTEGSSCASIGGWQQGWIVFHDINNNGLHEPDEPVIVRQGPLGGRLSLTGNLYVSKYVSFAPNGSTEQVSGAFQAGRFTLCRESLESGDAREIRLDGAMRPRVQRTTTASC